MSPSRFQRLIPATLVIALALAYPLQAQPVTEDWVDTRAGFYSAGVVTTDDGFAYITGRSDATADNGFASDIVTIKYDLAGNRIWERVFDETDDATNGTDRPSWLTLDPFGNVIVTGISFINTTGDDILTLKYDPDGNLLWKVRSTAGLSVSRVATDAAGNIYVAGVTSTVPSGSDFITIKYDPAGNELWTQIDPGGFGDSVFGLEVTPAGEAVVVGESSNGESCFDVTTLFYEPDGTRRWLRTYTSPITCGLDSGSDAAFGPGGEIYVGGHVTNGSNLDFVLIRYDQDGNEVWVRTLDEGNNQIASRLRVDSLGNPVLAGVSDLDFAALKYDPDGNLLWSTRFNISGEDVPFNMAIGPDDAVYLTGYVTIGSNSVGTAKLDATGNLLWTATWDAAVHSDIGWGVALDSTGNVMVSGQGQSAMLTIRYLQEDPAAALTVTATPVGAPIEIPAQGGTFRYEVEVINTGTTAKTFDLWITMSGNGLDRTVGPFSRTLAPGASLNRRFRQSVPAGAAAGTYTQTVSVGAFPTAEASDSFGWDKLP